SVPLGDVAANWMTRGRDVVVDPITARPLSGRFEGRATIPSSAGRPTRVDATFADIRTDQLADVLTHGQLKLTGSAGGKLDATIPADPKALAIDLTLRAPDLTVQGVPAGTVSVAIRGKGEVIEYELTADGAAGKVRFQGNVPVGGPGPDKPANAEIRAAGFGPADVARLLGIDGFPAELRGRAAIDANVRALRPDLSTAAAHGFVEARDLQWGDRFPIGNLRGILERTAGWWRIDNLQGDLFGGVPSGMAWGSTPAGRPPAAGFRLEVDRAALARLLAFVPWLAQRAEGFGTLRLSGRLEETLAGTSELSVTQARLAGVAIADLRMPVEYVYLPAESRGTIRLNRWTATLAGGRVQGTGWLRSGLDSSFALDLTLADVDVESLMRIGAADARPGSGKVNGRVELNGTDPAEPKRYRGRIGLGLHDASIGDIPVIRALDRFLGAAQGGAFEKGWLRATVADGRILVDDLRLEGRVLQIHGSGVVTLGGAVDLVVLVNTNQIIPETGEALMGLIPGLRQVAASDEEARLRVANYLSNRLLKFRVGGTVANPSVTPDRGVAVGDAAAGFFAEVLRLPLGFVK
ncbi:MAG TPA: AsmA-like C-terminal region-containing protein, partial [Isosphaeraceae bacterium]